MQTVLGNGFCLSKKHKIHYQYIITVRLKWKPISPTHSELKEWMYPLIISQTQRDSESFIWIKQQLNYLLQFVLALLKSLLWMDHFHFVMWLTELQIDLEIFNCPRRLDVVTLAMKVYNIVIGFESELKYRKIRICSDIRILLETTACCGAN